MLHLNCITLKTPQQNSAFGCSIALPHKCPPLLFPSNIQQGDDVTVSPTSGSVTDPLNPWCCRLSRAQSKFHLQRLASVPCQSLHLRAALLLRLNDRIEVSPRSLMLASCAWCVRSLAGRGGGAGVVV